MRIIKSSVHIPCWESFIFPVCPGTLGFFSYLVRAVSCNVHDKDMHMLGSRGTHSCLLALLDVALPCCSGAEDALAGLAKSAFG